VTFSRLSELRAPTAKPIVIGIGEFAAAVGPLDSLMTHALGSCVAICLWDWQRRVAGMIHFLLPDSAVNPVRARVQPAAFADTGVPLLFEAVMRFGASRSRLDVKLVGGARVARHDLDIGRSNIVAARALVGQQGLAVSAEATGGTDVRTIALSVATGKVRVTTNHDQVKEL
jgi:chemotaxis protein CheD